MTGSTASVTVISEAESAALVDEELALDAAREAFLATATGAVLAGDAEGRTSPEAITMFDSSGFALQDLTLAAALLRRRADSQENHK